TRRIGREHAGVERAENVVLRLLAELRERGPGLRARDLVDSREPLPIDVAQPHQRPTTLLGEPRREIRDGGRAEQLGAPAKLLETRERNETAEVVARPVVRRPSGALVGERCATAERTTREDARRMVVEGREERLDVLRGAELLRSGVPVGRDDAI